MHFHRCPKWTMTRSCPVMKDYGGQFNYITQLQCTIELQQIFNLFGYTLEFWYLNSKINIRIFMYYNVFATSRTVFATL